MKHAHSFALEARDAGDLATAERVLRERLAEDAAQFGEHAIEPCRTRFLLAMLGVADAEALIDAAHPVGWDRGGVSITQALEHCAQVRPIAAELVLVDGLVKAWGMGEEFGMDVDIYLRNLAELHERAGRADAAARCRKLATIS